MSAETLTSRALWKTVLLKFLGDNVWGVSAALRLVGSVSLTTANFVGCHGKTLLMLESHYAKRYEDLTGRSLGVACSSPSRHAMTVEEVIAASGEGE